MFDELEENKPHPTFRLGLNWFTVKLVLILFVGCFFVYILGIMTVVSVYHFPHVWNFYLSELIVIGILSIAPASVFHRAFYYFRTGNIPFVIKGIIGRLFGISYLISVVPLLLAVLYEYFAGFLGFL